MSARLYYRPMPQWVDPVTEDDGRESTARFRGRVEEWDAGRGEKRAVSRNVPLHKTERELRREADMLGASEVVVELDMPSSAFRQDGSGLRADRRAPDFPGVVVHLVGSRFGDLRYSCDRFTQRYHGELAGWEANLRAITLGLESLRQVERFGIARRGEQYAGWAALPPGTPLGAAQAEPQMTLDDAARLLAGGVEGIDAADVLEDHGIARTAYRVASKRLHPDNLHTGSHEGFVRLEVAWSLVEKHHAG